MPHVQAAHWMISSVVPTEFPSTLGYLSLLLEPRLALYDALPDRVSGAGRTSDTHSDPLGSDDPGGSVWKRRAVDPPDDELEASPLTFLEIGELGRIGGVWRRLRDVGRCRTT